MMISEKMASRINEQIKHEFNSYWIYLAMAFSFESMNLKGFGGWFKAQAAEEQGHAMKFAGYLLDQGAQVKLTDLAQPKSDYKSAEEIVAGALEHEKKITRLINEIAELAESEKDHATREFINWFIKEQVEEVSTVSDLLNMVKMAQTPGQLLMLQGQLKRD
jgi:ferritin